MESFAEESRNSGRRGDGLEERVGRYGTSIQVIVVRGGGGKRSLRRHLSLVHRGERHNLQGRSEDA